MYEFIRRITISQINSPAKLSLCNLKLCDSRRFMMMKKDTSMHAFLLEIFELCVIPAWNVTLECPENRCTETHATYQSELNFVSCLAATSSPLS